MAAPRIPLHAEPEFWRRLATHMRDARTAAGLSQVDAVHRSGGRVSLAVWSLAENARQVSGRMDRRSLDGIAMALGWPPDAVDRLLNGESPDNFPPPEPPEPGGTVIMADELIGLAAIAGTLDPADRERWVAFGRQLAAEGD